MTQVRIPQPQLSQPGNTNPPVKLPPPPPPSRCFDCGRRAIGTRDRRRAGGRVEAACIDHADTFKGTGGAQ